MKTAYLSLLVLLIFTCGACQDDDDTGRLANCEGELIQIVADPLSPASDTYGISDVKAQGLCLSFTLTKTGCGSDAWTADLLTNGLVAESLPTQTGARIVFDDGVEDGGVICQAEISKEFTFDLSPYLGEGALPTTFTLIGTGQVLSIE